MEGKEQSGQVERMEEDGFPEPGRNFLNYIEQREKKFFFAMKKDPLPPTSLECLLLVKNMTAMEARNS